MLSDITATAKRKILLYLKNKGYQLLKTKEIEEKVDYYRKVLIESQQGEKEQKIDSLVFSKDRAMQLHAFLRSYKEMVSGRGVMNVLYKASDERHTRSYEELKDIFKNDNIVFIKEIDFGKQLIQTCENSNAKTIASYVDDMIFISKVDYNKILQIDTLNHMVTLGRGPEMNYSVVLNKPLVLPRFTSNKDGFQYFRWDFTDEYSDWTYPVGVGGYFFGRDEFVVMLKSVDFKAPNSLEISLQKFKPMFIHRGGICMDQISCVAVHANIVQTEHDNPVLGTFSIESLLNKWEEGLSIDIAKFYGKSGDVAQLQPYEFVPRN